MFFFKTTVLAGVVGLSSFVQGAKPILSCSTVEGAKTVVCQDYQHVCPENGIFAHPDCTKMHVCLYGRSFAFQCARGMAFNAETQSCDYLARGVCAKADREPVINHIMDKLSLSYFGRDHDEDCEKGGCNKGCNCPPGPPGAPGPKGEKGDYGEQGVCGAEGPMGQQGPKGDKGDSGRDGAHGEPGLKGEQGERGIPGSSGRPGECGPMGQTGPKGDKGEAGERGIPGAPGARGERGYPGPTGPKGARGERGSTGETGRKGEKGDKGEPGRPGKFGKPSYDKGEDCDEDDYSKGGFHKGGHHKGYDFGKNKKPFWPLSGEANTQQIHDQN